MNQQRQAFFPWRNFSLWLRDGLVAGRILNKVMMSSWPAERRPRDELLMVHGEEIELLWNVLKWAPSDEYRDTLNSIVKVARTGHTYPILQENEARTLWLALTDYGTATNQFEALLQELKSFAAPAQSDLETLIRTLMDSLWRTIGPSMDPDRSAIEKSLY
jgi:hypothetical protein